MIKIIGFIIVAGSFIIGAFVSVINTQEVQWNYFIITAAFGIAGVLMIRLSDKKNKQSDQAVHANIETVQLSLQSIVTNIQQLNARKTEIHTRDIHKHIDELFQEDLLAFVDARKGIAHCYGLQAYADIMSCFAAAERYLNRVWSASADGYIDEVNLYLTLASEQFALSLQNIKKLKHN